MSKKDLDNSGVLFKEYENKGNEQPQLQKLAMQHEEVKELNLLEDIRNMNISGKATEASIKKIVTEILKQKIEHKVLNQNEAEDIRTELYNVIHKSFISHGDIKKRLAKSHIG